MKKSEKKLLAKMSKDIPSKYTGMSLIELEEVKRDTKIMEILRKELFIEDDMICNFTGASHKIRQYIKKLIKDN